MPKELYNLMNIWHIETPEVITKLVKSTWEIIDKLEGWVWVLAESWYDWIKFRVIAFY